MSEGTTIAGKYRLLALLGRGGMGAVWRAHDLDLDAQVAVKLLDPLIAASSEGLSRFHREAQAAAALRSPHVVQILERGVDEETHQPFIVMELMEGESLASRLVREGKLSPAQTARIVSHVARALARAHEAGIVHRDLKPDNIFLVRNEDEEIAKVLDFGIAKSDKHRLGTGSETKTGAVMGTPYYMSPEQISSSKAVDFRADLWALGVIACECLTGLRPFEADTYGGLTLKICAEPISPASSLGPVPHGFDAWFARAVSRDPAGRFESARQAADELRRVCGVPSAAPDRPTAAPAEPIIEPQTASTGAVTRTAAPVDAALIPTRSSARWVVAGLVMFASAAAGAALWFTGVFSSGDETAAAGSAVPAAANTQASEPASATTPNAVVADVPTPAAPPPVTSPPTQAPKATQIPPKPATTAKPAATAKATPEATASAKPTSAPSSTTAKASSGKAAQRPSTNGIRDAFGDIDR